MRYEPFARITARYGFDRPSLPRQPAPGEPLGPPPLPPPVAAEVAEPPRATSSMRASAEPGRADDSGASDSQAGDPLFLDSIAPVLRGAAICALSLFVAGSLAAITWAIWRPARSSDLAAGNFPPLSASRATGRDENERAIASAPRDAAPAAAKRTAVAVRMRQVRLDQPRPSQNGPTAPAGAETARGGDQACLAESVPGQGVLATAVAAGDAPRLVESVLPRSLPSEDVSAHDSRSIQAEHRQLSLPESAPGNSLQAEALPPDHAASEEEGPAPNASGLAAAAGARGGEDSEVAPTCEAPLAGFRTLGTLVPWADSVEQAAVTAQDQGKLLFVMHVSGNFELPGFT